MAGAGVLLISQGAVLLLKRSPEVSHPLTWGLPGGHAEPGERPVDTASREAFEEMGGLPSALYYRARYDVDERFTVFHYEVIPESAAAFVPKLNFEHTAWQWVPLERALSLPLHPAARAALERVAMKNESKLVEETDESTLAAVKERLQKKTLREAVERRRREELQERSYEDDLLDFENDHMIPMSGDIPAWKVMDPGNMAILTRAKGARGALRGIKISPSRDDILRGVQDAVRAFEKRLRREVDDIGKVVAKDMKLELKDSGFDITDEGLKMVFIFELPSEAQSDMKRLKGAMLGIKSVMRDYVEKYLLKAGVRKAEVVLTGNRIEMYMFA